MNAKEFTRLLRVFADRPEDIDLSREEAIVQIQNQLISLKAETVDGQVLIDEGGIVSTAERFVADRLANLPFLANRILDHTKPPHVFVEPCGRYIDRIESDPTDSEQPVSDVLKKLIELIEQGTSFASFVIYLTAEAGEGKTTLINQLARHQAQQYLNRKTTRLVVPIELGGRSFLRLDDLIIGSVANHFRFRGLYIDSFIELVKYGFLVPAFDGFEEMFVVGSSGEAVSSLGNLLANLSSAGQLLVSARTAYFEIRDFETQARLFDGLRDSEASFARLKIHRWQRGQFLDYWRHREIGDPEEAYSLLEKKLGSDHPLLTRAVLVKRLADIAQDTGRFERLLERLESASSYFSELVDSILEREIEGKWVDRAEDAINRPLLTLKEHHELLAMLSVEMAMTVSGQLGFDEVHLITELFCDLKKLPPTIARQVLTRIYDHPLLAKVDTGANSLRFDHDEFREFFLGEAVGNIIIEKRTVDFQNIIRKSAFSTAAIDACIKLLGDHESESSVFFNFVQTSVYSENAASFAKENSTKILLRLLGREGVVNVLIENAFINPDAFIGRELNNVEFKKCIFHDAVFEASTLRSCKFSECEFDAIDFKDNAVFMKTVFSDCLIRCVSSTGEDSLIFNPVHMKRILEAVGLTVTYSKEPHADDLEGVDGPEDPELGLMIRGLRPFHRSTGINESTLKLRLGKKAAEFEENILPILIECGILVPEPYRGSGSDRRFRLGVKMGQIQDALVASKGSFEAFSKIFRA